MTLEEYRQNINPCFGCGCWEPDAGCTMPFTDRRYGCPLETDRKDGEDTDNGN